MTTAILIIWLSVAPGTGVQSITHMTVNQCSAVMAVLDDPSRRPAWVRQWQSSGALTRIACVEKEP